MSEPPPQFSRFRTRAAMLVRSPDEVRALAARAVRKLGSGGPVSDRLRAVRDELGAFIDLLRAYGSGQYRAVSARALVSIAAAVLYFVVPLDFVPDFLLGFGLLDDAAVIAYVLRSVREELAAFQTWREAQP